MTIEKNMIKDTRPVMVSVLCATYNHEKYIESAIQSIVNQITDFRFELIVHEDASTDNTREVVEKYSKLYPDIIIPIYQKENQYSQGRGKTFQNMLLKSSGKYIAICEGDDFWIDEHKLQKQFDIMEKNQNCSICVHKTKQIFENEDIIEKPNERAKGTKNKYNLSEGIISREKMASAIWLEGGYPFQTSSYFIRRIVLEARVHNTEPFLKHMSGDMAMLRLCQMHGEFYRIDEFMSCRRRGIVGSWSARWAKYSDRDRAQHYINLAMGEKLFNEYSKYEFDKYIQKHIANILAECCIYEPQSIKELLKETHLSIGVIFDKGGTWLFIRYCILKISPEFYKCLFDVEKKIFKLKNKILKK